MIALAFGGTDDPQAGKPHPANPPFSKVNDADAEEVWPMTLQQAIRIALDNSEVVRVIAFGAQGIPIGGFEPTPLTNDAAGPDQAPVSQLDRASIVIAGLNADVSVWRLKADVMAHVRSVEQQYWNLAGAHVALWSVEQAVRLGQEVLKKEQAELVVGAGTKADVAEAAQRLEQFNLDLVTRTSNVITTERQFRNILGLPPADNRRIIPVTAPTVQPIVFDWDSCVQEMMEEQPDIARQDVVVRLAELQLLSARKGFIPPLSLDDLDQVYQSPLAGGKGRIANTRRSKKVLLRSRALEQQVIQQATHSLARFFVEIESSYQQYRTASRLRAAAAQRLDAQRAYYEEGRITIDRFLDAVSQYATAVATEAQYKTTYNISIVALEEAKGTLLAYDNIVVAEGPRSGNSWQVAQTKADDQAKTASFEPAKSGAAAAKPTKWTFSISIGWDKPLQIKGTVSSDDSR